MKAEEAESERPEKIETRPVVCEHLQMGNLGMGENGPSTGRFGRTSQASVRSAGPASHLEGKAGVRIDIGRQKALYALYREPQPSDAKATDTERQSPHPKGRFRG